MNSINALRDYRTLINLNVNERKLFKKNNVVIDNNY